MNPIFSIGIQSLWDEVSHMPTGGVWWVNTDRHEDAVSLLNQTLAAQQKEARVAVVCMGSDPKKIIRLEEDRGPQKIDLFSMQENESSLYFMRRDLLCSLDPTNFLIGFYAAIMHGKIFLQKNFMIGFVNPISGLNTIVAPF